MRQWTKIFEASARSGFLQNYFALTLVIGFGVLLILISFTVSVHHQYHKEFKIFETYRLDRHREIVNYLNSARRQFSLSYEALAEIKFENANFLKRRLTSSPYSCIMVVKVKPATVIFEKEFFLKNNENGDACRNYNTSILNDATKSRSTERTFSKASFASPEGTVITLARKMPHDNYYLLASVPVRKLIARHVDSPIEADIVAVSRVAALDPRYGRPDDTNMYVYASERFFNEVIHIRYLLRREDAAIGMGWAWLILLLGAVILGLVAYIIYNLIQQNLKIREKVQRTTQSLREVTEEAVEANETKSRFLASISHEIRTPLNLIMGMSELLSDTPINAEQKEYIATFNKASQHLSELMNDILDMAMVESGEVRLSERRLEVESLIESVSDFVAPACGKKKILYNHIISPDVPTCIYTDEKRLKQILINLLNNALKYTEKGEIQLCVRLESPPLPQPEQIVFDVIDTGSGIPPAKLGRIFDAFYQVESSSVKREGVGLGLALVKSYSKLLNGEVRVDSKEGRGSTFSVSLKLKADNRDSWLTDYKLPQEAMTISTPSVLLYSKNSIQEHYITQSLNWIGYKVKVVDSYHQAVHELGPSGEIYDKVILDLSVGSADDSDQDLIEVCRLMGLHSDDLILILPIGQSKAEKVNERSLGLGTALFAPVKMKSLIMSLRGQNRTGQDTGFRRHTTARHEPFSEQARRLSFKASSEDDEYVLIVDDDVDCHFLFRSYLADQKLNIIYMEDPVEALSYFKENSGKIKVVLTDLQMPGMDGRALVRNIREFEAENKLPATPIVALTGESADILGDNDFMKSITSYLVKPIWKKQLIEAIQSQIEGKRAPGFPGAAPGTT